MRTVPLQNMRRVVLFLYGVSTCFGTFAIGGAGGGSTYTISFMLAGLYMVLMLPLVKSLSLVFHRYAKYIFPPVLFFVLLCVMNAFYVNQYEVPIVPIPILSCIILYIFMLLHSLYDPKALTIGLYGFMLGTAILAVLFAFGIGIYEEVGVTLEEGDRLTMFGQNQNALGLLMANGLALITMFFIVYNRVRWNIWRFVVVVPMAFMFILLFASGSRAAFATLVLAILAIVFLHHTEKRYMRLLFVLVGVIGMWYGFQYLVSSELMYERIILTISEGNSSGRTDIWAALMPRLIEHPIFGVGQTGYAEVCHQELMRVANNMYEYGYSPHNVLIEVFAYTGIIGLLCMLTFWVRIFKSARFCYKNKNDLIPLLLLFPIILSILTGQVLADKVAWLSYAYIVTTTMQYKSLHHEKNSLSH